MRKNYMRAIPREWMTVSKVFTALGDEHRQRILLLFEKDERLNIGEIVAASTLSRSAVSHHLRILKEAKVLLNEKVGKEVYFWINKQHLQDSLGSVLGHIKETV